MFLSVHLSPSVCPSLSFSLSACISFLSLCPSAVSLPAPWFLLLLCISRLLPSLGLPPTRLSHRPSVHMAPVCLSVLSVLPLSTSPASLCPTAVSLSLLLCSHCLWAHPSLSPISPWPSLIRPLSRPLSLPGSQPQACLPDPCSFISLPLCPRVISLPVSSCFCVRISQSLSLLSLSPSGAVPLRSLAGLP